MIAINGPVLLVALALALIPLVRAFIRAGDDYDRILAEHDAQSERRWSE